MLNSTLVRDHFGQYYKIQTHRDKPVAIALKAESFHSNSQANRFVKNLIVPTNFWKSLHNKASLGNDTVQNNEQLIENIAALITSGKIKAYKVDKIAHSNQSPEKRTVIDNDKTKHIFTAASTLLFNNPKEVFIFKDKVEVNKYLTDLSPDIVSLQNIAKEFDLPKTQNGSGFDGLLDQVATGLTSGEIVVVVDKYSAPPPPSSEASGETHTDKDAGAGPEASATAATQTDICNCTIKALTATCSHGRSQGPKGILQIVATPTKSRIEEYELMGVKVTLKEESSGEDTVDCSAELQNNRSSGCYFITDENNQLSNNSTSKITYDGESGKELEKWPIDAVPERFSIVGHGCDKAGKTIYIEKLPNQYYTVQADLSIFKDWADNVNKGWEKWAKVYFDVSPVMLEPKITGPTGSFAANWGWKEDKDWRAFYNVSCNFGLNPILGLEFKIVVSMTTLALTAAGVPPNVAKLAADHIFDLRVSAGANCKASLTGQPAGKFYTDNSKKITGEGKFSAEGGIILEMYVRAGSDYVISAELAISGEAKVIGEDIVTLDKTGLFLQSNIMLSPLIGTAKVKIRVFKVRTKTTENKWEPWKQIELYKSDNKKILPR